MLDQSPPRGFWGRTFDRLAAFLRGERDVAPEASVAFTIAILALGAKLAKADGTVAKAEVAAFRRIFAIPRGEEKNAARVFDLARQTTAGYETWAQRIRDLFPEDHPVLEEILEGLAVIATADAALHAAERDFLQEVGRIFRLPPGTVATILARHDRGHCPPCEVLGISPGTPVAEARAAWKALVREAHPDRAQAHGLPPEAVRLAELRTRRLNEAWQQYRKAHA